MRKKSHDMLEAYREAGGMPEIFFNQEFATLMVHGNEVYGANLIEGLELECKETAKGVDLDFRMKKGYVFEKPVHICFGLLPEEGEQEINVRGVIENNSQLEFLAYCVFPNAINIRHIMNGDIKIEDNASFKYTEVHYHGDNGGVEVTPNLRLSLGNNSSYEGNFYLTKGRAGKIRVDYVLDVGNNSKVDMLAKVLASNEDEVYIKESAILNGELSKGILRTRVVTKDKAKSDILSEIVAKGAHSIGHVDCIETVLDDSIAKATPLVEVRHKDARVTHEAAIGSLNSRQLESLMAKGLDEEEAKEVLMRNILK